MMGVDTRAGEATVLPSFDTLFTETFVEVARAAALVVRDPGVGQELAQEAFFRLYERWSQMESPEHARRFAFRVAINLARSHLRKHLRVTLAGLEPRGDRLAHSSQMEEWLAIRTALSDLSPRRRAVVVLIDYIGMDAAEVGDVLGVTAGTVRAHLMRGRRDMRKELGLDEAEGSG
jgi:RNA polymerase sigma factor (sigma-70 family)